MVWETIYSGIKYKISFKHKISDRSYKSSKRWNERSYDKRRGWRGPITNKNQDINWKDKLDTLVIDPTLNWKKAEIIELNEGSLILNTKNKNIKILKSDFTWALRKKQISEVFEIGDFVFIKKTKTDGA